MQAVLIAWANAAHPVGVGIGAVFGAIASVITWDFFFGEERAIKWVDTLVNATAARIRGPHQPTGKEE